MKSGYSWPRTSLAWLIGFGMLIGTANADDAASRSSTVQRAGKPLYFVHLKDPPVAINARNNADARLAFADGKLDVRAAINRTYRTALIARQRDLEKSIQAVARDAVITRRFQLALNAIVVALDDDAIERVRTLPGVMRVERVARHEMQTDRGPTHVRAHQVWAGMPGFTANRGEGIIIGIMDSGIRADHPSFDDAAGDGYNHVNPWGENVYVGDCAPDKFPDLCNDKLIGIVSYPEITDSFNGERPANGWDYNGHGTHVASTAAGNVLRSVPGYNEIGGQGEYTFPLISGVAPRANIVAYQVCYPNGGCDTDLTVQAIDHAIDNGVDVLNYSVGGSAGNPWEQADTLAFLSARAAGIHVAVSTGNSGPEPGTVTSPGNSPWVTSVAAYTHDRGYTGPALTGFTGGENPPLGDLTGKGITNGVRRAVVMAADFGDALCREPFAAGRFRGAIVVCERGINPRVEKGRNVFAGGAGGMILINVPDCDTTELPDCATQIVADFHELPAIHLDAASGEILRQWLSAGTNHIATITAGTPVEDDDAGNRAGIFTSRGPALPFGSVPSPRIAAPGVDIYAAWIEDAPFRDQEAVAPFRFLEGTSMASPHVAGALALLKAAHPDWTPAEAQSALMSTANPDTRSHDGARSTLFDAGSGMMDVAAALNAGLVFDEQMIDDDGPDYLDTNPALGGSPADINMPAMANDTCLLRCSWKRTVKAVRATSWNVETEQDETIVLTVEPSSFTLAAGEELELTVTAELVGGYSGAWLNGRVTLVPDDSRTSTASLPLTARFVAGSGPGYASLTTRRNADRADVSGFRSVTTDTLQIDVKGLVKAETHEAFLHGDPTPMIPFDTIDNVVHVATATTTNRTRILVAEILEADAPDLDLYIARDANLDGKPNGAELAGGELCVSASQISLERCVVRDPTPGVYWIAVQNFTASNPDAADRHLMTVAVIEDGGDGLEVAAPAEIHSGEPYALRAEWNLEMQAGDTWYASIDLGTSPDSPDDMGRTLLRLDRSADDFDVTVDRQKIVAGDSVTYAWTIEPVATDAAAVDYRVSVIIPAGMTAHADAADFDDDTMVWAFSQAPGAPQRSGTLTLTASAASTAGELALPFLHAANGATPVVAMAPVVTVLSRPIALVNGEVNVALEIEEGKTLQFDANDSSGSRPDAGMGFEWKQTAGTAIAITAKGGGMFELRAPLVDANMTLAYELTVSSDGITSDPAQLTITVRNNAPDGGGNRSGGGGPSLWLTLMALGGCLGWRKRVKQERDVSAQQMHYPVPD